MQFTKEQLIKRLEERMSSARYALGFVQDSEILRDIEMDLSLAEIARTSLEAKPVLYAAEETLAYAKHGELHLTCLSEPMGDAVIPLYSAPPAPVVPDEMTFEAVSYPHNFDCNTQYAYQQGWNACRAAMLQGSQPVSNRDELPSREHFISLCNEFWNWSEMDLVCADDKGYEMRMEWDGKAFTHPVTQSLWRMYQAAPGNSPVIPDGYRLCLIPMEHTEAFNAACSAAFEESKSGTGPCGVFIAGHRAMLAAAPQQMEWVKPVIPDGCVVVPKRLTAENFAKAALSGEFSETKFINCPECFGDGDCETCDGSGRIKISVPVSWTNIKAIWAKGVEHFAAAPQQEAE